MIQHDKDGLRWYTLQSFDAHGIVHAFVTRLGGVSPDPYKSLNLGSTNGDKAENVETNRQRMYAAIGRDPLSRYNSWQVHGVEMLFTEKARPVAVPPAPGDGIFTRNPEVTLTMVFADCVPILLYDPVQKAVGIVHAGWGGTLHQVARVAIEKMTKTYGSKPEDLIAGIGPSICGSCYEVGEEVYKSFLQNWGNEALSFFKAKGERYLLDLWNANEHCLRKAGLEKIEQSLTCTAEHLAEWYSYRKEQGATGRFAAVIALNDHAN